MFRQEAPIRRLRPAFATAAIALGSVLGLTACSSDEEPDSETPAAQDETSAPAAAVEEPAEEDEDAPVEEDEGASDLEGEQPEWAYPVSTGGDLISTIELDGGITVEIYQIGTAEATKTGNFVDPENNEPIISVGDEVVFVNYVVTNNGDPVDLGSSLASIDTRYDDWPYLQGMDGITDSALTEDLGVSTSAIAETRDPTVYTLGTGQSYSVAENFLYEPDSPFTADVTMTPVDAEGQLAHEDKIEGEGTGTIQ